MPVQFDGTKSDWKLRERQKVKEEVDWLAIEKRSR